jgi:hypothetical protein
MKPWLVFGVALGVFCIAGCKPAQPGERTQTKQSTSKQGQEISAKLEAIRQAGDPTSPAELEQWIAPALPAEQNAAVKFTEAFALLVRPPQNLPELPARTVRLPASTRAAFAALVATNQAALEKLQQATVLSQSCYSVNWSAGNLAELPHLASIKAAAKVAQMQSALLAEGARPGLAVNSVRTIVSLARSLDHEPLLISQLVRIAVLGMAHATTERLVSQRPLPEADLAALQTLFRDAEKGDELTRTLAVERCLGLQMFNSPPETLEKPLVRDAEAGSPPPIAEGLNEYLSKHREEDLLFYLEHFEKVMDAAKQPMVQCLGSMRDFAAALEQEQQSATAAGHRLSTQLLPALTRVPDRFAAGGARLRAAQTALAVERYRVAHNGRLPEQLADLVPDFMPAVPEDPFTGQPLRFHKLTKGYVVYSVGGDGQDDGGKEKLGSSASPSGYDLTFTVER